MGHNIALARGGVYHPRTLLTPRIERPDEGLARGLFPTTPWVVIVVGVVVFGVAVLAFVLALRSRRRRS